MINDDEDPMGETGGNLYTISEVTITSPIELTISWRATHGHLQIFAFGDTFYGRIVSYTSDSNEIKNYTDTVCLPSETFKLQITVSNMGHPNSSVWIDQIDEGSPCEPLKYVQSMHLKLQILLHIICYSNSIYERMSEISARQSRS